MLVRGYDRGLAGVRAGRHVAVAPGWDPERAGQGVLVVTYDDDAGRADRDVWNETEVRRWSGGRALVVRVRADGPLTFSVSFFDANGVGYTAWAEARGGGWEAIAIPLDKIRPNPYFQSPTARLGSPLDLHDVRSIGFAPHGPGAGRFMVAGFVLVKG
jgi:hypothetical protein